MNSSPNLAWSPFKLKSFQAQQCGLVEPVINGVITPINGPINGYLETYNPYCNRFAPGKISPFFCASELLPQGRWKHCFPLLRSPCGDRTSTTPSCLNFGLKGWCVNNKGVWERFIWWIWKYIYIYIDYDIANVYTILTILYRKKMIHLWIMDSFTLSGWFVTSTMNRTVSRDTLNKYTRNNLVESTSYFHQPSKTWTVWTCC